MNPSHARSAIALVGLSGSGKSTVAPLLASRLGGGCADLDARIEATSGMTIRELFATRGEPAFRELECDALAVALEAGIRVIACGGGVVEGTAARTILRERCHTVWLQVEVPEALRRMGEAIVARPLLATEQQSEGLAQCLARRAAAYAEVSRTQLDTRGLTASEVVERILHALRPANGEAGS